MKTGNNCNDIMNIPPLPLVLFPVYVAKTLHSLSLYFMNECLMSPIHVYIMYIYIKLVAVQILLSVFFALIAMGFQRKKSKRYYYVYAQNPFGGTVSKKITKKYMLRNKRMSIKNRVSCLSISFSIRKPL